MSDTLQKLIVVALVAQALFYVVKRLRAKLRKKKMDQALVKLRKKKDNGYK